MEAWLELWWIFPVAILFATVAIGSGVSGALFFSPFFMLALGLTPAQAVGAGLLTELFGMGNGLRAYVSQRVVDYKSARWLLLGAIPMVAAGALVAHLIPSTVLKLIFGGGLIALAGFLVLQRAPEECEPGDREGELMKRKNVKRGETLVAAKDGTEYRFPLCWRPPGVAMAAGGGFITGVISAGLPEIVTTQLVTRCHVPPRVAVATSVFVLAITAAVGAGIHALSATPVWHVVAWTIPGVLIGSTVGSTISKHLPGKVMEKVLGVVFALVGLLVLLVELVAG
ncbi:MAG: TSUP family transporter [Spirochaetes bacterium]|jgi:uncharacterized membrane protein YfcA|nr:TSUP family transporter [Spirochaetota bacterium]